MGAGASGCCFAGLQELFREKPGTPAIAVRECPRSILVNSPGHRVQEAFRVKKNLLGKGGFGTVKRAINKKTGAPCVMKEIPKMSIAEPSRFQEEVKLQAAMDHPHIVRIYETFEDKKKVCILMEACDGGDVMNLLEKRTRLGELDAWHLFRQLMSALCYMHHHSHVVHRDIKPDNLLLKEAAVPTAEATVKLTDFGFARKFEPGDGILRTVCGTPYYAAPEVLQGEYDERCDIWSSGVTLYFLLSGNPPFPGDDPDVIARKAKTGKLNFKGSAWQGVSASATELISQMCHLSPNERPSAHAVLVENAWMRQEREQVLLGRPTETSSEIAANLQHYSEMDPVKKTALKTIVHIIHDSDIKLPRDTFESLDTHGEGTIPVAELRRVVSDSEGLEVEDVDVLCSSLDAEGHGEIDYSDWLSANVQKQAYLKPGYCWEAFRIFDKDSSGKISLDELRQMMAARSFNGLLDEAQCMELLAQFDKNGDGELDFDEFVEMLGNSPKARVAGGSLAGVGFGGV